MFIQNHQNGCLKGVNLSRLKSPNLGHLESPNLSRSKSPKLDHGTPRYLPKFRPMIVGGSLDLRSLWGSLDLRSLDLRDLLMRNFAHKRPRIPLQILEFFLGQRPESF